MLYLSQAYFAPRRWFHHLASLNQTPLILSMREGFIALIPFFVISSLAFMLIGLQPFWPDFEGKSTVFAVLNQSHRLIMAISPLAIVISLSYHLSKNLRVNTIVGSILACLCFITHSNYLIKMEAGYMLSSVWPNFYSILIPLLVPYMVRFFRQFTWLKLVKSTIVSSFLMKHINLIVPFVLVYLTLFLLLPILDLLIGDAAQVLVASVTSLSIEVQGFLRMIIIHCFWFIGIHGDNTYLSLFSDSIMTQPFIAGLSLNSFYNQFVIVGGSGCLLSLIIATMWKGRSLQELALMKVSLPFNIFNFCELIVYALPIVFNPVYLVPFILAPSVNFLISYWVLGTGIFEFSSQEISWMTPVLLNSWLISGDVKVVLYQALLITLNVFIYLPFVLFSSRFANNSNLIEKLSHKLKFTEIHQLDAEARYTSKQRVSINRTEELNEVLNHIDNGQLMLHYQPKVDIELKTVIGFEALLRLEEANGKVSGPWFMDILDRNNLVPMIDFWVINKVKHDLNLLASRQQFPFFSINIHPMSLLEPSIMHALAELNAKHPAQVQIEVLEVSFDDDSEQAWVNLALLQQSGFSVAIDDFGRGFSNLSRLIKLSPNDIKLDRSMLLAASTTDGLLLFQHMSALCSALGYRLVAEGVETRTELAIVKDAGVHCVQGWLFARAMPIEDAMAYRFPT